MLSKRILPLACLLLTVSLVYANSFTNSFHFDDFHTVTDNPAVRSLRNLPRIFTDTTAFSVLPANQTYRPVVTASLALDYALGHGYTPFWFHLSTLLWFLVLIGCLFSLVEVLLERTRPAAVNRWLALGVAAWFGLHPAMAETINYVIQRGDLYCTLGCAAALLVFARLPAQRRFGLYLVPFALAMLSKPPAAVFPVLLLAYVFFFEAASLPLSARWRKSLRATLPSVAGTALLLWLQAAMTPKTFAPTLLSATDYRRTEPYVWLRYCSALFFPLHLNVDTDLQLFASWNGRALLGCLFVLLLALAFAYTARRRQLYPIAFGLLWFVVTQLPTSLYPLSEVENDHRMFFSFPGLMLAVVWALYLGYERLSTALSKGSRLLRPAAITLSALLLCAYAYGAHRRNRIWRTEDTLWADDVAKSPHNGRGLMIFGLTRMNAGDLPGALALFNRALLYTPNYAILEINLGVANSLLADRGISSLEPVAEAHFQRALALTPGDDLPHAYFGRWLLAQGRVPEATAQLEEAVALNGQRAMQRDLLLNAYAAARNTPAAYALAKATLAAVPGDSTALAVLNGAATATSPAAALINASLSAYRAGQFEQSINAAQQALAIDPHSAEAWNNIGAGYGGLHEWDRGIAAEQKALALNPNLAIAGNNLRWFLAQRSAHSSAPPQTTPTSRTAAAEINLSLTLNQASRYRESIAAARQALAIDPQSAEAWNNIAADEEALSRWDEAIAAATKAVALRPDFQLAKNNLTWARKQRDAAARH